MLLLAGAAETNAQIACAGYSQSYLLRNVGSRAIAMAGTYTAFASEPNLLFYNPAGLSLLAPTPQVATSVSALDFGRTQTTTAWGQTIIDNLGVGAGINTFTTAPFTARDVNGNSLGNVSDFQMSMTAGASYSMEFISVGVAFKYLYDKLNGMDISSNGYAVDFGTLINVYDMFDFGLSVQNVSGIMFWKHGAEESSLLPYTIRAGVSTVFPLEGFMGTPERTGPVGEVGEDSPMENEALGGATRYITFGMDAVLVQHENGPTFTIGVEAVPDETVAFRAGFAIFGDDNNEYKFMPGTTWGCGISIRPDFFNLPFRTHVDYSVGKDLLSKDGIGHHVSLIFNF